MTATATRTRSATARLDALRAELETLREREVEARAVLARAVAEGVPPEEYAQARAALTSVTDRRAEIDLAIPMLEEPARLEQEEAGRVHAAALERELEELTAEVQASWRGLEAVFHRWGREVLVPALEAHRSLFARAEATERRALMARGEAFTPGAVGNYLAGVLDRDRADDLTDCLRVVEMYATKLPPLEEAPTPGGGA